MSKKTNTDATAFKQSEVDGIFHLVKKDGNVHILVGNFKVSNKTFKTWKQAEEYIASKPYELIINLSVLFSKLTQNEKEQNAKESEKNATETAENTKSVK